MKLGLLIDLDTCVGCHACATACKEWNGSSSVSGPLSDYQPFGAEPSGVWLNRVRHYEVGDYPASKTINFPMSCLHCADADCVSVCPTGASYKRADGIVLVDEDKCMGCKLCACACPTHARMFGGFDDPKSEVSRVTAERGGFGLLPELGYAPVNRYLPPREPQPVIDADDARALL